MKTAHDTPVVPAEAPGPMLRSLSRGQGVWVPAFAGTTGSSGDREIAHLHTGPFTEDSS